MNLGDFYAAAYGDLDPCNPLSPAALDALIARAAIQPGERALDLGCGRAGVTLRLAALGATVEAVDASPAMLDAAGAALARAEPAVAAKVRLRRARAEAVLAEDGPAYDVVTALGVAGVVAGGADPAAGFRAVRRRLAPGGRLLFGDTVWRRAPTAALTAVLPGYGRTGDYQAAARAAGFAVVESRAGATEEWDAYVDGMQVGVERFAAERPGDASAATFRARMATLARLYRREGRGRLGFVSLLLTAA